MATITPLPFIRESPRPVVPQWRRFFREWISTVLWILLCGLILLALLFSLVVYLVYGPLHNLEFTIQSANLNAAHVRRLPLPDVEQSGPPLLDADIDLLANITNPNRMLGVPFSGEVQLYLEATMVKTGAVPPHALEPGEFVLEPIHLVARDVELSEDAVDAWEMAARGLWLQLTVAVRLRAQSGPFRWLQVKYHLVGKCNISVGWPPHSSMSSHNCEKLIFHFT